MTAPTPGPWKIGVTNGGKRWIYAGALRVAKAASNPPKTQREANERLIAAAPDLLAALVSLIDQLLRYVGNRIEIDCTDHADAMQRVRLARAAILKATGV